MSTKICFSTCDKKDPKMSSFLYSVCNSFTSFKYLSTRMWVFTIVGIVIVTWQPISTRLKLGAIYDNGWK